MDTLTIQFFIANCLSFNVVDSPSFLAFTHSATGGSYVPLGRTKLTAAIDTLYHWLLSPTRRP